MTVSTTAHERRSRPEARERGATLPAGVPAAMTSFVGRARERNEVEALLLDQTRLVTLVGAGGCGKTRLAREVAADAASRLGIDARWVELAGLEEPALVAGAVAAAVDVRSRSGVEPVDALTVRLGDTDLLLVLDNCEHLAGGCAEVAGRLLRACPGLRVLATSREPLAVDGEVTYPVEPLPLPDPRARTAAEIAAAESVQLFELRARQARPDFELHDEHAAAVAGICRHLDGIPLALELAAARVRVLTPRQIEQGLSDRFRLLTGGSRDAPARQRTLEASLDWSYDLLAPIQRLALARLSVFAGGFDLDAAQGVVAGEDIDSSSMLDLLTALAERSLLQVEADEGPARYRLLETIRLYAGARLAELDDPDRVRDRHLEFHVGLAEQARAGLAGPHARAWASRLAAALDDLRAAMDRGMASQRPLAVLDVAEPTFRFWFDRGLYPEMRRRLRAAIDDPSADDGDRARGSVTAALLAVSGGDFAEAHALADRAVARLQAAEDDGGALGLALILRAWAGFGSGLSDDESLEADARQALALAEGLEDGATRAHVLNFAGQLTARWRSVADGRRLLERAVAVCEQAEVAFHLPAAHAYLGLWLVLCGELEPSRAHARTGIDLSRQLRRPGTEALARAGLAAAETFRGDEGAAREQVAGAQALLASRGLTRTLFDLGVHYWGAIVAYRFGDHDETHEAANALRTLSLELNSRYTEATAEWLLGVCSLRAERPEDARQHFERSRGLAAAPHVALAAGRATLGLAHLERAQGEHDRAWELAHEGLGLLAGSGDRLGAADALEAVADVGTCLGRGGQALRLLAAADRFREQAGVERLPLEAERSAAAVAQARAHLRADEAAACWEEGTGLSLEEAVTYARRGRGERDRPETGWGALTPTEHDLVHLVVEGHTNAQIGERLFISPNTVKKHLSTVYAKVGVAGRAELAAEAVRRGA